MGRKKLRQKRSLRKRLKQVRLREGFWKRLWRALPALLLTGLLTVVLVRVNALDELAIYGQDKLTNLSAPPKGSDVAIVMINDEDYKEHFKATSPLEPTALQELISAIASGGPKVIGVDIDTSDQRFRDFQIGQSWPLVIWVRPSYDTVTATEQNPMSEEPVPLDVLGGKDMDLNDENSGLPAMISVGGVTRFYQRMIETNVGTLPSFPWAVVKKINPNFGKERVETTDQLVIKFAGDPEGRHRANLSALQILEFYRKNSWPTPSPIKDKIVLLGGSYLGSGDRDQKDTPLGKMYGVHILASVVETELEGGGIKRPDEFALVPLWITQGLGLVLIFQIFPMRKAILQNLGLSLGLIVISSLICSFIASRSLTYHSLFYLGYFIPVGVLVFILQVADDLNDWRRERLKREYENLSGVLQANSKGKKSNERSGRTGKPRG